jgi:hypothetical protein
MKHVSNVIQTILSGIAALFATLALVVALTVPGPMGPSGPSGASGETGLSGSNGQDGSNGAPGENGITPSIGENGNWWIGDEDTFVSASNPDGIKDIDLPMTSITMTANEKFRFDMGPIPMPVTESERNAYAQARIAEGYIGVSSPEVLMSLPTMEGRYVLTNDITFTNQTWAPIDRQVNDDIAYFSGTLDGAGYTIENLDSVFIDDNATLQGVGLFNQLEGAEIRNLELKNFSMLSTDLTQPNSENFGALAGVIIDSIVTNVTLTNTVVKGSVYVGGLSGSIYASTLTQITSEETIVIGDELIGGLTGILEESRLTDVSLDTFLVGDRSYHGGVAGSSGFSSLIRVSSQLAITDNFRSVANNRSFIGGIFGTSDFDRLFAVQTSGVFEFFPIEDLYSLKNVGGIVGTAYNTIIKDSINDLYISVYLDDTITTATIDSIGGFVGSALYVSIQDSINEANIGVFPPANGLDLNIYMYVDDHPVEYIGGLIGYVRGTATIYRSVNLGQINGPVEVGGIIGSTGFSPEFLHQLIIIKEVANFGSVNGAFMVGGFMGISDERTDLYIVDAINYGNITATEFVGGFIGLATPTIDVNIYLVNLYNRGVITADYYAGGIIGGAVPYHLNFEMPFFGHIHIIDSFNAGLLNIETLGVDWNQSYLATTSGAIVGGRYIPTSMYGVSYMPQYESFPELYFDFIANEWITTGRMINVELYGSGSGQNIDLIAIENASYIFDPAMFVYQQAWNFATVWQTGGEPFDQLPMLQFLFLINLD